MTRLSLPTFVIAASIAAPALAEQPSKPQGITIQMPLEHTLASGGVQTMVGRPRSIAFAGPGEPPLKIFLNRNGGDYSPGNDDSRRNTSIIPNGDSTVTPFGGSASQWNAIVSCITQQFAQFNVVMVQTEPPSGEYVEAVIGGSPDQLGLPRGVGGVAPIDSFQCNVIPNAIVFAFSDVYGDDPQSVCETAAQEIAHAFSLDHEFHCPDPMTYLNGCGDKSFRDVDAQCGEYQARACNCGRSRQNSVQVMLEKLGPANGTMNPPPPPPPNDHLAPTIVVTSPANPVTMPGGQVISISADIRDDNAVGSTELVWLYNQSVFPCPANLNGGSVTCTRSGNISTWNINVGQGDRHYVVRATDTAGNQSESPDRVIHLGMAGPPPSTDTTPPTAFITTPADGATLPANTTIQVIANAADANGIGSAELVWNGGTDTFPCPFTSQGVNCTSSGTTFTWSLNVGVGTRRLAVRAIDPSGNSYITAERTITLSSGMTTPPPSADTIGEPNDNPGEAFATRCGTAIDLVVTQVSEDWFSYDVPVGTDVSVGINAAPGTPISLELFDADGTTKLAEAPDVLAAGGTVHAAAMGAKVLARVSTMRTSVPYRLSATCKAGTGQPPASGSPDAGTMPPVTHVPPAGGGQPSRSLGDIRGSCSVGFAPSEGGAWVMIVGLALLAARRRR